MRHLFILNPNAGAGDEKARLINELAERKLEIYFTKEPGDAERYIKRTSADSPSETIRYYACGGDGTLSEVAGGVFGFENAEAACIPIGSGNDFIRNFAIPKERFLSIDAQLAGSAVGVDLIKYSESGKNVRYAINMVNIGFDCNVVKNMANLKKRRIAFGSLAYLLSIFITLVKKESEDLLVEFDDGRVYEGRVLLTAIGNGAFCGGGMKGIPYAEVNDGLLDLCIIKDISRLKFLSLFPQYPNGAYIADKKAKDIIIYKKQERIKVKNKKSTWHLCVDGEIREACEISFEVVPNALQFSLPR